MGMLIRRRIHEMQEKPKQKESGTVPQFKETAVDEGEDIEMGNLDTEETEKLSYEDLSAMTVRQIKELAEQKGFSISKIIKDDVITEFLENQ